MVEQRKQITFYKCLPLDLLLVQNQLCLRRELGWMTRTKVHRNIWQNILYRNKNYSPAYLQNNIAHLIPGDRYNTRL